MLQACTGDAGLWFYSRLLPRKKLGPVPKRNRMTHRPHGVKVEAEVVDSIEDLGQNLIGGIKMAQIGAGVAPANPAAAIGVQRPLIRGVSGLLDRNPALGRKQ